MKDATVSLKACTFKRSLKAYILIGLCTYVLLLSITVLTHDHTGHGCFEETCAACFYNSQHLAVAIIPFAFIFSFFSFTILSLYETVFLPLRLTTNTRSRAPPVFSNKLSIVTC